MLEYLCATARSLAAVSIVFRASLIVAALVVCVTHVGGVPAALSPASSRILPGKMEPLYAAPGDLFYSYGPSLERRSLMDQMNAVTANIIVTYDAGFQANAPAQAAFQAAVNIWQSSVVTPVTIRVSASYIDLGNPNILGQAGSDECQVTGSTFFYANALADKLAGADQCLPGQPEIFAQFNNTFSNWDFGTTGNPIAGKYNFLTVVLHELGHGLGFFGSMSVNAGQGSFLVPLSIFDWFSFSGSQFLRDMPNPSLALGAALVSNNVYFGSANAFTSNSGSYPKLESALNPFQRGSSYSHVDDTLYSGTPNGLMTWALNSAEVYTDPGPIVRGIFKDVGWTVPPQQTLTLSVQGSGTVRTADGFIQCPAGACSHAYALGTTVTLQATPLPGSVFAGWSSTACSSGTVLMTVDRHCGATFLPALVGGPKPGSIHLSGSSLGDVLTYNSRTGARTSQFSDGQMRFGETRGQWSADWQVSAADFNGDGLTDFFLYNATTGQWFKATNNRAGDFSYFTDQWRAGWQVFIVDLNGDHHSDVFLYDPRMGDWFRCVSTGAGTGDFAYVAGHWIAGWQVYPADLNGDRVTDFFLYSPSSGFWYQVVNDGVAGFRYTAGTWALGWSITPGDFNGDGRTDFFLSRAATGEWYVATTTGASGFTYRNGQWVMGWTFTVGDFNADGKADLFLYNPATGGWFEAFSDGAGGFMFANGTWSANWQVQVTDFNGDGRSDVLLYNPTSGQWFQAVNAGVGAFTYGMGVWDPGLAVIGSKPRIP
jgi:hypothetical protein